MVLYIYSKDNIPSIRGPILHIVSVEKDMNPGIKTNHKKQAPLRDDGVVQYVNMKYEPDPEFQSPIVAGKEDPWTSWALGRTTGVKEPRLLGS